MNKRSIVILMADDDDDDYMLTRKALEESKLLNRLFRVKDGVELMNYLQRRGAYVDPDVSPTPGLILLDLNMPRKDGRQALLEIRSDASINHIPVVVLTTSKAEEDIIQSYQIGANSYVRKPVEFEELVKVIRVMGIYWFEIVELPK